MMQRLRIPTGTLAIGSVTHVLNTICPLRKIAVSATALGTISPTAGGDPLITGSLAIGIVQIVVIINLGLVQGVVSVKLQNRQELQVQHGKMVIGNVLIVAIISLLTE